MRPITEQTPAVVSSVEGREAPRASYTPPMLREYGSVATLTRTRTCANGYNDGTGVGCSMSFKKS